MAPDNIRRAAEAIQSAEAIFIGAGAGLSAAAGLDYNDDVSFAERYPAMLQYGFRNQYQLMGYKFKDPALKWGYLAATLKNVYDGQPTSVYENLRHLIASRDYFVMTSNVDRYFYKNKFDADKIYTPQGDYEYLQCMTPCHLNVWDAKPIVAQLIPSIDPKTQIVQDPALLPVCPNCGEAVYMNVRGGSWFIDQPYTDQAEKLNAWLSNIRGKKLVGLEIGAGYNTPGVIRGPMEAIGTTWENTQFIRINLDHATGPGRTLSIKSPANVALEKLAQLGRQI